MYLDTWPLHPSMLVLHPIIDLVRHWCQVRKPGAQSMFQFIQKLFIGLSSGLCEDHLISSTPTHHGPGFVHEGIVMLEHVWVSPRRAFMLLHTATSFAIIQRMCPWWYNLATGIRTGWCLYFWQVVLCNYATLKSYDRGKELTLL